MTATAIRENEAARWEAMRFSDKMPESTPTYGHRMGMLLTVLSFCLRQTPGPAAILDIGAGTGQVGRYARISHKDGHFPAFAYHATEQTDRLTAFIKTQVPDASAVPWSFEPDLAFRPVPLAKALEQAEDSFLREYPVVVLSHVLEHVSDYYGLLDEAWSFVKPGGFLVICVPRNDEHRTHSTTWEWNRLLAVLRQYSGEGAPIGCWECGSYADLYCAVPKAMPMGQMPAQASNGVVAVPHVDERVQGSFPTGLDTAAHTPRNGRALEE